MVNGIIALWFSARQIFLLAGLIKVLNIILVLTVCGTAAHTALYETWNSCPALVAGNIYILLLRQIFKLVAIQDWETLTRHTGLGGHY